MAYQAPYDRWTTVVDGSGYVSDPALDRALLDRTSIGVHLDPTPWEPQGTARERWLRARDELEHNDVKLRLTSDIVAESSTVLLQETDYAAFIATNRAVLRGPRTSGPSGPLAPFSESTMSNHLGGDLLAIDRAAFYLQRQRPDDSMNPGAWVASASGSFDREDLVTPSDDLVSLIGRALIRELREELDPDVQLDGVPHVLSLSRWTSAGGKPQALAVALVEPPDPRPDEHAVEVRRVPHHGESGLVAALGRYADGHEGPVSPQLRALHALLSRSLEERPGWLLS